MPIECLDCEGVATILQRNRHVVDGAVARIQIPESPLHDKICDLIQLILLRSCAIRYKAHLIPALFATHY